MNNYKEFKVEIFGKNVKELSKEDIVKLCHDFYKYKEDTITTILNVLVSSIGDNCVYCNECLMGWKKFLYKHIKFDTPLDVYINIDPETGERTEIDEVDYEYIENILKWSFTSCGLFGDEDKVRVLYAISKAVDEFEKCYIEESTLYEHFLEGYKSIINL